MEKCEYHDEVFGEIRKRLEKIDAKLESISAVSAQMLVEQSKVNAKTMIMCKAGIFSIMGAAGAVITFVMKSILG